MARLEFLYVDDHSEAPPGTFYKMPHDSDSYLRVRGGWPSNATMIEHNAAVAGVTQPGRQEAILKWLLGKDRKIELVREPDNPYDADAVQVIGSWAGMFGRKEAMLGYLPREIAGEVANTMITQDVRAWPKAVFPPSSDRDAGLRLKIGFVGQPLLRPQGGATPPPLPRR